MTYLKTGHCADSPGANGRFLLPVLTSQNIMDFKIKSKVSIKHNISTVKNLSFTTLQSFMNQPFKMEIVEFSFF